jgi:hypothetical protein
MSDGDVPNAANRDEANRARGLGMEALRTANSAILAPDRSNVSVVVYQYKRAVRMLKVSLRMYENPSVRDELNTALAGLARAEGPRRPGQSGSSSARAAAERPADQAAGASTRTGNSPEFYPNIPQRNRQGGCPGLIRRSRLCTCVHPDYRVPIAFIFFVAWGIILYRWVLHRGPSWQNFVEYATPEAPTGPWSIVERIPRGLMLSMTVMFVQRVIFGREEVNFFFWSF